MYQGNTWLVLNKFEMFDEEYAGKGPMHTKEEQVLARNLNDEQGTCTKWCPRNGRTYQPNTE